MPSASPPHMRSKEGTASSRLAGRILTRLDEARVEPGAGLLWGEIEGLAHPPQQQRLDLVPGDADPQGGTMHFQQAAGQLVLAERCRLGFGHAAQVRDRLCDSKALLALLS